MANFYFKLLTPSWELCKSINDHCDHEFVWLSLAFNKDDPVLYLKCKLGEILRTDILFPLMNDAKERAFAFAAKQQMSKMEYDRRSITGTLESSSVRVAIALLGLTKVEVSVKCRYYPCRMPEPIHPCHWILIMHGDWPLDC